MNKAILRIVVTMAVAVLASPGAAQDEATNIQQRFTRHMSGTESCLICHGSFNIIAPRGAERNESLWVDPDRFLESSHARLGCTACHSNIDSHGHRLAPGYVPEDTEAPAESTADEPQKTPGMQALEHKAGDREKRTPALLACIDCHIEIYRLWRNSVHGMAVMVEGHADPPFCIDCHGWHYILPPADERALTNPLNIPKTCQKCHAQAEIRRRYGLTKNVAETFEHSFHSRRGELGSTAVAVCTSCHGWHDIYAPEDALSRVNASHVSQTCAECHQGAQYNFAAAFTHGEVSRTESVGIYAVTQTHKWLIVLIIGPLVLIVFMDLAKSLRSRRVKREAHD